MNFLNKIAVSLRGLLSVPLNKSSTTILALYTILWGLWVANPFWDVFSRAPLYNALSSVAPEVVWGGIALVCGCFMLWGVLRNSVKSLTWGAFVGFMNWFVIGGGYFIGDWQNTGGITTVAIAIFCGLVYLNAVFSGQTDDDD